MKNTLIALTIAGLFATTAQATESTETGLSNPWMYTQVFDTGVIETGAGFNVTEKVSVTAMVDNAGWAQLNVGYNIFNNGTWNAGTTAGYDTWKDDSKAFVGLQGGYTEGGLSINFKAEQYMALTSDGTDTTKLFVQPSYQFQHVPVKLGYHYEERLNHQEANEGDSEHHWYTASYTGFEQVTPYISLRDDRVEGQEADQVILIGGSVSF